MAVVGYCYKTKPRWGRLMAKYRVLFMLRHYRCTEDNKPMRNGYHGIMIKNLIMARWHIYRIKRCIAISTRNILSLLYWGSVCTYKYTNMHTYFCVYYNVFD